MWPLSVALVAYWYREDVKLLLSRLLEAKFPGVELKLVQSGVVYPAPQVVARKWSEIEYRILKTLWTKQVNKFPKYEGVWSFRVNRDSPEYESFWEAGGRLIGEGFVDVDTNAQLYLTVKGFTYCRDNHKNFPDVEEWYPHETLIPEKLQQALRFKETARVQVVKGVTTATSSSSSTQNFKLPPDDESDPLYLQGS